MTCGNVGVIELCVWAGSVPQACCDTPEFGQRRLSPGASVMLGLQAYGTGHWACDSPRWSGCRVKKVLAHVAAKHHARGPSAICRKASPSVGSESGPSGPYLQPLLTVGMDLNGAPVSPGEHVYDVVPEVLVTGLVGGTLRLLVQIPGEADRL